MDRFTNYYTCFYEKHFELYQDMYPRVEAFLDSVLAQVEAEGGAAPPSEACLGWMCDPGLRWRLLTMGGFRLWTYTSPVPVTSWGQCFDDTNNQEFNQLPQGIQRESNTCMCSVSQQLFNWFRNWLGYSWSEMSREI